MTKLRLFIELEYDEDSMHGGDPEAKEWFLDDILGGTMGELTMFSSEIGDVIGKVTVLSIEAEEEKSHAAQK